MTLPRKIRLLIVDDSAFARKVVREIVASDPEIELVGVARDGLQALEITAALNPDVVVCDLVMPNLDGAGFVRRQMSIRPLPILILSSAAGDAAEVIDALNGGAFDVVRKPSALASDDLRTVGTLLRSKIHAAVGVASVNLAPAPAPAAPATRTPPHQTRFDIVVIGISTGGPQALRQVLPALPANLPVPVAVVLHMPIGYTALYAEKLNEVCALEVRETLDGMEVVPGKILIAAAGRHLMLKRLGEKVLVRATIQPVEKLHRPSADVLFSSAAEVYGGRVLAVVMTGMGNDGTEGATRVKAAGGTVLTEDEKSCVIYGMPGSVVDAGVSDESVPLGDMARAITSRL